MLPEELPNELLAQLRRKGHGDIATHLLDLRWELLCAAKREDWDTYDTIRQCLNLQLRMQIPRHDE